MINIYIKIYHPPQIFMISICFDCTNIHELIVFGLFVCFDVSSSSYRQEFKEFTKSELITT